MLLVVFFSFFDMLVYNNFHLLIGHPYGILQVG